MASETPKQRVLFVCGHNAGRSICAEAICRHLRPDIEVASCGTYPSGTINPNMVAALKEAGIPTEGLSSKSADAVGGIASWPRAITMGCMDSNCPRGITEDWNLPDPAKDASVIPQIIEEVTRRVKEL